MSDKDQAIALWAALAALLAQGEGREQEADKWARAGRKVVKGQRRGRKEAA